MYVAIAPTKADAEPCCNVAVVNIWDSTSRHALLSMSFKTLAGAQAVADAINAAVAQEAALVALVVK